MKRYFYLSTCRRKFVLNHFNQPPKFFTCNKCDNCCEKELTDITPIVWSIYFPSAKQLDTSHLNKHEIEFIKKSLKNPKLNKINNVFCEMDLVNWKNYIIKKKYTYNDLPDNLKVRIYFKDIYDEYMANQYERSEDVFDKYSNMLKDIKI